MDALRLPSDSALLLQAPLGIAELRSWGGGGGAELTNFLTLEGQGGRDRGEGRGVGAWDNFGERGEG
jgi:hypothetical protein